MGGYPSIVPIAFVLPDTDNLSGVATIHKISLFLQINKDLRNLLHGHGACIGLAALDLAP